VAVLAPQVGGWLLDAKLGVGSNFLAFAVAAGVASVLLAITLGVTRRARQAVDTGDATSTKKSAVAADALVH
jgi:AAHS family benzoate transporter-like MFS transporter